MGFETQWCLEIRHMRRTDGIHPLNMCSRTKLYFYLQQQLWIFGTVQCKSHGDKKIINPTFKIEWKEMNRFNRNLKAGLCCTILHLFSCPDSLFFEIHRCLLSLPRNCMFCRFFSSICYLSLYASPDNRWFTVNLYFGIQEVCSVLGFNKNMHRWPSTTQEISNQVCIVPLKKSFLRCR